MPHTHYTTLISAANLAERLAAAPGSVALFDCRFDLVDPPPAKRVCGRPYPRRPIPPSRPRPVGPQDGTNGRHPLPTRDALATLLASRGLKQGQQVVAYDARRLCGAPRWLLRWLGHDSVAVLDGGLQAWEAAGQPLTADVPHPPAGDFRAAAPLESTVDAAAVLANVNAPTRVVIDARAPDRYRGENETIDRVGGHIPGARNRFFKDNLTPTAASRPAMNCAKRFPPCWRAPNRIA